MTGKSSAGNGAAAAMTGGLPLFYKDPKPVTEERHGAKSLTKGRNFAFAAKVNSIPLAASEFLHAARSYPIVFAGQDPATPLALLGLDGGVNHFVSPEGEWKEGCYVPAYARRYPFIFSDIPGSDQLALCVDEESGFLEEGSENPFFTEGKPSEQLQSALKFCERFQRDFDKTSEVVRGLAEAQILVSKELVYTAKDGQQKKLTGFRIVDEQKLSEVDDETFLQWRRKGWLGVIYAQIFSLANIAELARHAA